MLTDSQVILGKILLTVMSYPDHHMKAMKGRDVL